MPLAAGVLLVGGLAACSGDDGASGEAGPGTPAAKIIQPGAPGEPNRELDPSEVPDPSIPHSPADVAFAQRMIAHHAQATAMIALVEGRSESRDVALITQRMAIGQIDEVERMQAWLAARGEDVPDAESTDHGHHAPMPGMATAEDLARLEAATGPAFDRLLLELMIAHHEGARQMVDELLAAEGGQEEEIGQLALHIESDQRIEISRMQSLLAAMG